MQPRLATVLMMLALVFSPALLAGGKKEAKASITFHTEADANDNPKMIFSQLANGKTRYFNRMPEISTKDIVSFTPFPSDAGGDDYGVVFRLNETAARRLAAMTNQNQGRWVISQINGRVVDGFLIDKQVDDGHIVIWKGVTIADITVLDASMPRTGQENRKKK